MAISAGGVRRAAAAPLVAGLLLASVSCTADAEPGASDSPPHGSAGSQTASSAPPGRFRTLPEPCGAVPRSVLARLLPGTAAASPSPGDSGEAGGRGGADGSGKPSLTYDTDRRVGCEWSGESESWNRYLHVDFERVVSYDPTVSDEEQAQEDYLEAAGAADVPSGRASDSSRPGSSRAGSRPPASSPPPTSSSPQGGSEDGKGDGADSSSPRTISGIGDEAFLEDRLRADAAEPHREVVIVFRKENVLVKVELREWPPAGVSLPSGSAMQVNAHLLAQELAKRLNDQ